MTVVKVPRTLVVMVAALVGASMLVAFSTATALGAISFHAPFTCGETYVGSTYDGHNLWAIDFNQSGDADEGDPVLASASGVVSDVYLPNGEVQIDHGDAWTTISAHMSGISVGEGESVQAGQLLGFISDVGNAQGAHLHYQQLHGGIGVQAAFDGSPYVYGTSLTSANCSTETDGRFVSGDFNGDGRSDVATMYDASASPGVGATRIHVWTSSGSGFSYQGAPGWWSVESGYDVGRVGGRFVAGDFNADGKDDIASLYDASTQPGVSAARMHVWLSTGSAFTYQGSSGWWSVSSGYPVDRVASRLVAGDFDGDGDDDVAALYDAGSGAARMHVWISSRTGLTYQGSSGWWTISSGYDLARVGARVVAGDFDEDGDADVAAFYDATTTPGVDAVRIHVWRSSRSGFTYAGSSGWWSIGSGYPVSRVGARFTAGDFDGDGDTDVATLYDSGATPPLGAARLHVWTSTGSAFAYSGSAGWWSTSTGYAVDRVGGRIVAGRFDSDADGDVSTFVNDGSGAAHLDVWAAASGQFVKAVPSWWSVASGYPLERVD